MAVKTLHTTNRIDFVDNKNLRAHGHCGNEHIHPKKKVKEVGCSSSTCDNPTTRNTFTAKPNRKLKLHWMVFNCTTWSNQAATKIGQSTGLVNRVYSNVGISFQSYLKFYPCRGTDGKNDYSTFDPSKVVSAVLKEKGSNFKAAGAFIMVAGIPSDSRLLGFMVIQFQFVFNYSSSISHTILTQE